MPLEKFRRGQVHPVDDIFPAVVVEVWFGHDLLRINEHWERLLVLTVIVVAIYGFLWWRKKQANKRRA